MTDDFRPSDAHKAMAQSVSPTGRLGAGVNFDRWQRAARARLLSLLGDRPASAVGLNPRTSWRRNTDFGSIERLVFTAEAQSDVPCFVCLPNHPGPYDFVICVQGHTSGMHVSLGLDQSSHSPIHVDGDRDFATGCLRRGYAALCIEQRGFGERREDTFRPNDGFCYEPGLHSLLLGRTLLGERVFDISRAVDYLHLRDDVRNIGILGNSGGGTVALYATALDSRIAFAVPSCCFSTFTEALLGVRHCLDNYVPGIMKHFDMGDIAGLVAPRPLVLVAGRDDHLFPLAGARDTFRHTQKAYDASGFPNLCALVEGQGGHRFYEDLAWGAVGKLLALVPEPIANIEI